MSGEGKRKERKMSRKWEGEEKNYENASKMSSSSYFLVRCAQT